MKKTYFFKRSILLISWLLINGEAFRYALNFCSAFVVPNHPVLTGVLSRASSILKEWSGNSSLDAYQSCNPNRVKLQLAALYEAIKEQHIAYCHAPSSFGDAGQRVRLSDNVLSGN